MTSQVKTLMLGWEFPPYISGGLGTACYGLTKAMDCLGMPVVFVLPKNQPLRFGACNSNEKFNLDRKALKNVKFYPILSSLRPYTIPENNEKKNGKLIRRAHKSTTGENSHTYLSNKPASKKTEKSQNYGRDIYSSVQNYTEKAAGIAVGEEFDIIHAHDWMTYPAAETIGRALKKPVIAHIHSTEFDRSGLHVNQDIYDIERRGMHTADKVIAVSNFTRKIVTERYSVEPQKVEVVYNGVEYKESLNNLPTRNNDSDVKNILFLGRITMQKGPEYFIRAANRVLQKVDNVRFIIAGSGDMDQRVVEMAASLGMGSKVLFTGFLRGDDVDRVYRMADLYVMPSVSEPFGIAPLEALRHKVPVIISKQSGISEVLVNALKVDFWDVEQLANNMVAILKLAPLSVELRENSYPEIFKFCWEDSALRIRGIYRDTLSKALVKQTD